MRIVSICIFLVLAAFSCQTDEPSNSPQPPNYFPVNVGDERVYRIDSIDFVKLPFDTLTYWIREVVEKDKSVFLQDSFQAVGIYRKNTWTGLWQKIRTDYIFKNDDVAQRYSENIIYNRLTFPPSLQRTWNSVPFNDVSFLYGENKDFSETSYAWIHDYHIIGKRGYDSTLNVVYSQDYNLINRHRFSDKYANRIGLYRRYMLDAEYQPLDPESSDTSSENYQPVAGYKLVQTLVRYSINN